MILKEKAISYNDRKNFIKGKNIQKTIKYKSKNKFISLPKHSFSYGVANKPGTPIKNVINNNYGNNAEIKLNNYYRNYFNDISKIKKLFVKKTQHFKKLQEHNKKLRTNSSELKQDVYKSKQFQHIHSKLPDFIQSFKSYRFNNQTKKFNHSCENLIPNQINLPFNENNETKIEENIQNDNIPELK